MSTSNATSTPDGTLLSGVAHSMPDGPQQDERFARLAATRALGDGALKRWLEAKIIVAGGGILGGAYALEAHRTGASVLAIDPERWERVNLGTQQAVEPGRFKVDTLLERAEAIEPGRMQVAAVDARHVGVGVLRDADLLVDTTDDPTLCFPFTLLSNALGLPMLRLGVDGTGSEYGRVACSHGGEGHACAACTWDQASLGRATVRTPCPGQVQGERAPTIAGRAIGLTVVGVGLLQAQRLLGGNDADTVLDREVLIDLDGYQLMPLELTRSEACLSRHERWELEETGIDARDGTVAELFDLATTRLGTPNVELDCWFHPLLLECWCPCGHRQQAIGSRWAATPACAKCGGQTHWTTTASLPGFNVPQAQELGILERTWASLGLPERGALITAYADGPAPLRLLLS